MEIWRCHQEIESAEKLHKDVKEIIEKGDPAHWKDAFGRKRNLEMGVPSGSDSMRIFQVSPSAALLVITDHIQATKKVLGRLNTQAKSALNFFNED